MNTGTQWDDLMRVWQQDVEDSGNMRGCHVTNGHSRTSSERSELERLREELRAAR